MKVLTVCLGLGIEVMNIHFHKYPFINLYVYQCTMHNLKYFYIKNRYYEKYLSGHFLLKYLFPLKKFIPSLYDV